jgi:outer membrane murein-binding lipoprotein Lpp
VIDGDFDNGLIATVLAALGISGGSVYRVAHKQSELSARVDRLDEDRKEAERRMDEGRERLEDVRQTVTRLDTKIDTIIDLVKER